MLFSRMLVVGLTGGLASGKSTVAKLFEECGAAIIDADRLARQVVEPGKPAWRDIVRHYRRDVLHTDRTLNRHALAAIVFRKPHELRILNQIVHPRIAREQARLVRELTNKDPKRIVMYDAPLLIEAGAHRRMDKIIVVFTDRQTQIARLQARNHLSPAEALRRIRAQIPLREKLPLADYVIDGRLPIAELRRVVRKIYLEIKVLAMQATQKG
jgi:dephospho-CoA kinase